jgi:predicted component of type VI protein secretion system
MRIILTDGENNSLSLSGGETIIGRGVTCSLRFNDPAISRKHARIVVQEEQALLEDLGTTNGTLLNDERISGTRILAEGDRIAIGRRCFTVQIQTNVPSEDDEFDDTTVDHGEVIANMAQDSEEGALLVISNFQLQQTAPPPKVTHYNCPGCRTPLAPELAICPECGFKLNQVRSMSKTLEIRTDLLDRRTKPRRLTNIPCLYTSDSLTFEAHARDVSRDGLFIATELVDAAGTPCAVTLLPDGKPPYTLVGVVSRVVNRDEGPGGLPRGMGVRFSHAGDPR